MNEIYWIFFNWIFIYKIHNWQTEQHLQRFNAQQQQIFKNNPRTIYWDRIRAEYPPVSVLSDTCNVENEVTS